MCRPGARFSLTHSSTRLTACMPTRKTMAALSSAAALLLRACAPALTARGPRAVPPVVASFKAARLHVSLFCTVPKSDAPSEEELLRLGHLFPRSKFLGVHWHVSAPPQAALPAAACPG